MTKKLSKSALKVQEKLLSLGFSCEIVELKDSTRSADDAARAVGCQLKQIVKSLVFKGKKSNKIFLIATSGKNRVNTKKIEKIASEPIKMPDANYVREKTGFAIGGIPPVGHTEKLVTYIDEDLFENKTIWAAAGNPHSLFRLTPEDLKKMTHGTVIDVKQ